MRCGGRSKTVWSHLGNNGVLVEAVSINQEGVTVRFGKICIAPSPFWLLGVNIGNAFASGTDWPCTKRGERVTGRLGTISVACSLYALRGGRVVRQGPGFGQGLTNNGGSCICIGLGIGPGPTHGGGPLCPSSTFGLLSPYS